MNHAMLRSRVAYDETIDDTYILLESHSFYDATDKIYDDGIFY